MIEHQDDDNNQCTHRYLTHCTSHSASAYRWRKLDSKKHKATEKSNHWTSFLCESHECI